MENFFYFCLFVFWTLFWSFSSVLIYRLKSWESGIMNWRSHCPKCNNILEALQLIPVISWVKNLWKCHYCKAKISSIYPILELSTWILFTLIWYFLIDYNLIVSLNWFEIIKLLFWLGIWFITILYTFYDILFLEIHEWIMLSWIWITIAWLIFQSITWYSLINTIQISEINLAWYFAIPLTLSIIWWLYLIMLKELKEWIDITILWASIWSLFLFKSIFWIDLSDITLLNWMIWVLIIYIFFYIQIVLSWWRALWGWDLRIAIMIWLMLWLTYTFAWLMLTYMVWSIIWVWMILASRIRKKWSKITSQVPFWPFLAIWFFMTIFYSNEINNLISIYF